jgi:hypothetical protein
MSCGPPDWMRLARARANAAVVPNLRCLAATHDAGHRIADLDFTLARHIDAIAAGHGPKPLPARDA